MYMLQSLTVAVAAATGLVSAASLPSIMKRSPEPALVDGKYVVSRQAQFDNHATYTFDGLSDLPSGLDRSLDVIGSTHKYVAENVFVRDGYLQLLVNGGQTSMPYTGGQVVTSEHNIFYASVRTVAILSEPKGVCNGIFFYKGDDQETDIEWLSDPDNTSSNGEYKLWLTNQENSGDGQKTTFPVDPPANPTSTEHEYRIDWTEGLVQWFIDGVQVAETNQDVPFVPGPWVFNNWSNGDIGWSAGPPGQDALFKIRSIDMYYNTA